MRDENPTRRFPAATLVILAINVAAFLYELSLSPAGLERLVLQMGLVPGEITGGAQVGEDFPVWLTLLTSMFLHGGFAHLLGNMLYLWIFGNNIEDLLGPIRYVLFYLVSGLGAAAGQILAAPHSDIPMVGASGAIAGLLGAYLVIFPRVRVLTLIPLGIFIRLVYLPAWALLGFWFLFQVLLSQLAGERGGGVAFFAHIGGFACGMALIWIFMGRRRPEQVPQDRLRRRGY